jgi:DNA-binding transcriptional regulator YdaS (Cro superfamily)
MQLAKLIDEATAIAGSQRKLAERLDGATQGHVSEWRSGTRPCPDKHILAMAQMVGRQPVATALAIYRDRLGELAKTLAIGAVVVLVSLPSTMYRLPRARSTQP